MVKKIINQIILINKECFLTDDYYSDSSNHTGDEFEYLVEKDGGEVVGYIIFKEFPTHIESLRRALTKEARGLGLGVKLTKRLIRTAKLRQKDIYTYVSKTNLPSLNSNIKCGYRIYDFGKDWVYLRYKVNGLPQ